MNLILLIGITGATFILIAFALNQFEVWKSDDLVYDAVNLLGGTLLLINAYATGAIPFLLLNGVWTLVSLRDVFLDIRDLQTNRNTFKWMHHRRKH